MVKFFDKEAESAIVRAIRMAEENTSGEIRVHLKKKCKKDVLAEARKIFKKLGMHRTEQRNAVLIFVSPESRQFAIVGDAGIHEKVKDEFWDSTRDVMADFFRQGKMKEAVLAGVGGIGEKLKHYFPAKAVNLNELPNTVTED